MHKQPANIKPASLRKTLAAIKCEWQVILNFRLGWHKLALNKCSREVQDTGARKLTHHPRRLLRCPLKLKRKGGSPMRPRDPRDLRSGQKRRCRVRKAMRNKEGANRGRHGLKSREPADCAKKQPQGTQRIS